MSRLVFLLSGEGPTDIGTPMTPEKIGDSFYEGPLTFLLREMLLTVGRKDTEYDFRFVSRALLENVGKTEREARKIRRRSKNGEKDTAYYFFHAAYLGITAIQYQRNGNVPVIAIFFKDS
ncbi:MAG: hypothetical protein ACRC2T_11220, partial [Thermoguttaceae bacterium]